MEGLLLYTTLMLAAGSLVMALYWLVARPASAVEDRLREINPRLSEDTVAEPVSDVLIRRIAKPLAEKMPVSPRNVRRLRRRLMRAGFYSENAVMVYQAIRLASVIALPLLTFFVMTVALKRSVDMTTIGLTIVALCYGAFMPIFILSRRITVRQQRIRKALPDALDLMVVCVEAGLGLNAALNRVGQEMDLVEPALAEELAITNREIRAGRAREEALRNLGERTGVEDIKSLVAMLVQTDRFGTSIADSLRVFADSMRIKRRQRAEEQVAKAAVKLIFPLLLFIFPALLIVLMGPALIKMYELFYFLAE